MTYNGYTTIEIGKEEVVIRFKFDHYSGAPEYKTWNGWRPEEPPSIEVTDAWYTVDATEFGLPEPMLRVMQMDANVGGRIWDDAMEAVLDGP